MGTCGDWITASEPASCESTWRTQCGWKNQLSLKLRPPLSPPGTAQDYQQSHPPKEAQMNMGHGTGRLRRSEKKQGGGAMSHSESLQGRKDWGQTRKAKRLKKKHEWGGAGRGGAAGPKSPTRCYIRNAAAPGRGQPCSLCSLSPHCSGTLDSKASSWFFSQDPLRLCQLH